MCLVETKTDDLDEIIIPSFTTKFKKRKAFANRKSGVLCWPLKKIVKYINPLNTESSFVFWFKISKELLGLDEDVIFGIVYIPPEYTVYSSIDAFSEIENEDLTLQRMEEQQMNQILYSLKKICVILIYLNCLM